MNLLPRWVWMRSDAMRRGDSMPEPDPGDMGTAFGLDASLAPPVGEAPPPIRTERVEGRAWLQRLDRRPRR